MNSAKIYDKVFNYLHKFPKYREDCKLLTARYWWDEMRELGYEMGQPILPEDFIRLYLDKLTSENTISRMWRLCLSNVPEFRGASWKKRQTHAQEKVKQDLRDLTFDKL